MQRLRVLVLDDDASFLEVVRDVLEAEGFVVVTAREPLPAAEARPYDVVVLDLMFRRSPIGLDLIRDLRASAVHPKIVVCSADRSLLRATGEDMAGPDLRYLAKPFEIEDLLGAIRDLTGG